jgi:hypothetical protein
MFMITYVCCIEWAKGTHGFPQRPLVGGGVVGAIFLLDSPCGGGVVVVGILIVGGYKPHIHE